MSNVHAKRRFYITRARSLAAWSCLLFVCLGRLLLIARVFLNQADYMNDCFTRVMTERKWEQELRENPDDLSQVRETTFCFRRACCFW